MQQCDQCLEHCPTAQPRIVEEYSTIARYCNKCYSRQWFQLDSIEYYNREELRDRALELQELEFKLSGVRARG